MKNYCKIYLAGSTKAPYDWVTSATPGINRLYIINDGIGGYILDDNKIPFKENCLYFYPAQIHYVKSYSSYKTDDDRVDHSYVNFEIIPPLLSNKVICINPLEKPDYKHAIDTLKYLMVKSEEVGGFHNLEQIDKDYMESTIIYIVNKIINEEECKLVVDNIIIESLNIMHENLSEKLSVEEIAKKFNLSTEGFIRKFKRHLGVTPYSYLKNLRKRTALIMRAEGYSLSEIAEKCGYSDSSALLHAINNE